MSLVCHCVSLQLRHPCQSLSTNPYASSEANQMLLYLMSWMHLCCMITLSLFPNPSQSSLGTLSVGSQSTLCTGCFCWTFNYWILIASHVSFRLQRQKKMFSSLSPMALQKWCFIENVSQTFRGGLDGTWLLFKFEWKRGIQGIQGIQFSNYSRVR